MWFCICCWLPSRFLPSEFRTCFRMGIKVCKCYLFYYNVFGNLTHFRVYPDRMHSTLLSRWWHWASEAAVTCREPCVTTSEVKPHKLEPRKASSTEPLIAILDTALGQELSKQSTSHSHKWHPDMWPQRYFFFLNPLCHFSTARGTQIISSKS